MKVKESTRGEKNMQASTSIITDQTRPDEAAEAPSGKEILTPHPLDKTGV